METITFNALRTVLQAAIATIILESLNTGNFVKNQAELLAHMHDELFACDDEHLAGCATYLVHKGGTTNETIIAVDKGIIRIV